MIVKAICINNEFMIDETIPNHNLRQLVWNTKRVTSSHPHLVVGEWYQFDVNSKHQQLYTRRDDDEYHMIVSGGVTVACGYIFNNKIKDEKYQFSKFFVTAKEWRESKLEQLINENYG